MKVVRRLALVGAACALVGVPVAQAEKPAHPGSQGKGHGKGCAKTLKRGFVVRGTLDSFTPDNPATTDKNEAIVTLTVTGANRHARLSGELKDMDASKAGVQVKGGSYTVDASKDPFKVALSGFEPAETPAKGDRVVVIGKVEYTKQRCAPSGTSVADRYGDVNVRKVQIIDSDGD